MQTRNRENVVRGSVPAAAWVRYGLCRGAIVANTLHDEHRRQQAVGRTGRWHSRCYGPSSRPSPGLLAGEILSRVTTTVLPEGEEGPQAASGACAASRWSTAGRA